MRYLYAAAILAALAGSAHAQMNMSSGQKTPLQLKYEREEQEQKENERQYNATMKRLKTQNVAPASNDPWRKVRQQPASDTAKR
jgi:hypothetical protein